MRRHARVDVLSIVTFNYWFRERDSNSQTFLIDVHKYSIYDDKSAIIMPRTLVSYAITAESLKLEFSLQKT